MVVCLGNLRIRYLGFSHGNPQYTLVDGRSGELYRNVGLIHRDVRGLVRVFYYQAIEGSNAAILKVSF